MKLARTRCGNGDLLDEKVRPLKYGERKLSSTASVLSTDTVSTYEVDLPATIAEERQLCEKPAAFVVVDPWSTGDRLCAEILDRGYELIVVWENSNIRSYSLNASQVIMHDELMETVQLFERELKYLYDIRAILPGSETGVLLAEKLAHHLAFPTNPPMFAEARRNKYLMAEKLREKGVRAVKQLLTTDVDAAVNFVKEMRPVPFKVILKPNMGAGSDDVFLCKSMSEVEEKFNIINGKLNSLGIKNDGVLVQEYLDGKEYVIDSVSRDGNHSLASIWVYDKREVNNRFNVYFGSFPMVNNCELTEELIEYVFSVLDALEFRNGPAHAEIKMTSSGPCLVEIGARCHGGGGTWLKLAQDCWDVDQVSATIEAFESVANKDTVSAKYFPKDFYAYGSVLDFVQYEEGELESIPGDTMIRHLPSFSSIQYFYKTGDKLPITVDCNTSPGQVILIHPDREQVEKDYHYIHKLLESKDGMFKLKRC